MQELVNKILLNKKKILLSAVAVGIFIATVVVSYHYFSQTRVVTIDSPTTNQGVIEEVDIGQQPEDLKYLNVLLLGYGGPGHAGGFLTDVIQLVHVDFEKQIVALISIPRDLWVTLPNGTAGKINSAFTLGGDVNKPVESGAEVSKLMASDITGMTVNYYLATDFVSFKRIVGYSLDGIEVNVEEALDDPWYPITGKELEPCGYTPEEIAGLTQQYSGFELEQQFPCRYEHLQFSPGLTKMEGEQALKFVRSRHGSGAGDFSRSQRQHAVLKAMRDKLISLDAIKDLPQYFADLSQHTSTDANLELANYLAPALQNGASFKTFSIILSTDNVFTSGRSAGGASILLPKAGLDNWQETQQFIESEISKQIQTN